jgi:hypothetical protein
MFYKQTINNALIRSGRPYMITKMNDSLKMDSTKVGSINALTRIFLLSSIKVTGEIIEAFIDMDSSPPFALPLG